jgi:hypothetical protein
MDGTIRVYRAKVKESFKGCMKSGRVIKLVTASDSGLCGVHLDRRKEYVVALGEGDRGAFEVNTCGFVRAASSLSPSETEFLQTRFECCGNRCSCTGTDFVHCFVDPCSLESCGDATCVANHCGGCNAEFFGPAGQPVCTACDNAFDCGAGQTCDGGLCVPDVACVEDADCAADSWCRPSEAGGSSCAPFVGEGETCGGFVLPWTADRCEPGLICAPAPSLPGTPPLPDLPGICTAP